MFQVEENTTFYGIADLRTEAKSMLGSLKVSRVVITERNKPRAVVMDYEEFEKLKDLLDMAEEEMVAPEVIKRKKQAKKFLSHQEMLKRVG